MTLQRLQHLGSFSVLPERQQAAILALVSAPNQTEAARRAGVDRSTLWRYQQDPDFREALADARRELAGTLTLRLLAISDEAVAALERALSSGDTNAEIRAAREILERIDRRIEIEDLDRRIEAIEREVS